MRGGLANLEMQRPRVAQEGIAKEHDMLGQFSSRVGLAALGIVVMQASVALSELGSVARIGALVAGLALIVGAALVSASALPRLFVSRLIMITFMCALGFEALSAFNGHLVFDPKLIVFRFICYALVLSGVLIGLAFEKDGSSVLSAWISTLIVTLIAIAAPFTWRSLQTTVLTEATRGSFDESSPVALGFSSGTLAIAALVIALRSPKGLDYVVGLIGYAAWVVICLQSGSRGALLSLVLASLIITALSLVYAPKRVLVLVLLVVASVAGRFALGDAIAVQASYVFERFESILNLEADASIAGSADSRAYLLDHNLNLPGLLLLGGEGFDPQAYPHNFEIEALVRLGAPIALVFVLIVIYLLWKMLCTLSTAEPSAALCVLFAMGGFAFFNAQTNMMWEVLRPLWLSLGVSFGMLVINRFR